MLYNILLLPALLFLILINPIKNSKLDKDYVVVANKKFYIDIADTDYKRSRGLMFRESLGKDEGMLFVFNKEGNPVFYNKNVNFPLTFIWINKDYEIVDVTELPKDTFQTTRASKPVKYVLEVNKGVFKDTSTLIGEKVEIKY